MKPIKSILVTFPAISIEHHRLVKFRNEVKNIVGRDADEFHNHTPDGKRIIRYPKIQYRVIEDSETGSKTAAFWGVESGVESIKSLLDTLEDVAASRKNFSTEVEISNKPIRYRLNYALLFNGIKWADYCESHSIRDRVSMVETAIVGNILNFCQEVGYKILDKSLKVEVLDFAELGFKHCPTEKKEDLFLMAFDVIYEANIVLPPYIGLGRFKALGYGWQTDTQVKRILPYRRAATRPRKNKKQILEEVEE